MFRLKIISSFTSRAGHSTSPGPATTIQESSVGDADPQVYGLPGSESIGQRYGFGFGSFPFLIKVLSGLK
jgi:hypothetical protein